MLPQSWQLQQSTGGASLPNNQTLQACQQNLRLQSLQMERERLKQRQQEIARQQVGSVSWSLFLFQVLKLTSLYIPYLKIF